MCAGRERFQPFMYERSGGSLAVSLTVHLVWTCGRVAVRVSVGAGEVPELPFLVLGAAPELVVHRRQLSYCRRELQTEWEAGAGERAGKPERMS